MNENPGSVRIAQGLVEKPEEVAVVVADAPPERRVCCRPAPRVSTGYVGAPRGRKNCTDIGKCVRVERNIPRGERYELCRSVHAEANAIISAPRDKMIDATLYLVGKEVSTGDYVKNAVCCSMCKRMVINAGIARVIVRDDHDRFREIDVQDWIINDESIEGVFGY